MDQNEGNEIQELKSLITEQNQKIDRILTWAEGDRRLGTPSIKMQIDHNNESIKNVSKLAYENRGLINENNKDIKNIKKVSGAVGGTSGGAISIVLQFIKSTFS